MEPFAKIFNGAIPALVFLCFQVGIIFATAQFLIFEIFEKASALKSHLENKTLVS